MYEVSWCLLGKDAEAEPFMFTSYQMAQDFLSNELFWLARDTRSTLENKLATEAGFAVKELKEGSEYSILIGEIHYWLISRFEADTWMEF